MSDGKRYGDVVMKTHDDGTVTVISADNEIGIWPNLLDLGIGERHIRDGMLVCDTAGQYRYRPVRFDRDQLTGKTVVVCERVR